MQQAKKTKKKTKKIAILASGGDSPGMNTAIYAIVQQALFRGYSPYVVYEGYRGLVNDRFAPADYHEVQKNASLGGSFIYSARLPEFATDPRVRKRAADNLKRRGIAALFVIGGDGSYQGARLLSEMGINCICLPGTIDNDINSTEFTIGFYSSLNSIYDVLLKINDTAISHCRPSIIEVMGRYCADLSYYVGLASSADLIIAKNNYMTPEAIARKVKEAYAKDPLRRTYLIVIAERIYGANKNPTLEDIKAAIAKVAKKTTNINRLGYLQRGGAPNIMDRFLAMQMGMHAVDLLAKNAKNRAIGLRKNKIVDYPIATALRMRRSNRDADIALLNTIKERI